MLPQVVASKVFRIVPTTVFSWVEQSSESSRLATLKSRLTQLKIQHPWCHVAASTRFRNAFREVREDDNQQRLPCAIASHIPSFPHMHFIYPLLSWVDPYIQLHVFPSREKCYRDARSSFHRIGVLNGDGIPARVFWLLRKARPRRHRSGLKETVYDRGFSFFSFQRAKRPTPETLTTLNRTPGISPFALPRRPKPEIKTSSFSSTCPGSQRRDSHLRPNTDSRSSSNRHWERRR